MREQPSSWDDASAVIFCGAVVAATMYIFPLSYKIFEKGNQAVTLVVMTLFGLIMMGNYFYEHHKHKEVTPFGVAISFLIFGVLSEPINYFFPL